MDHEPQSGVSGRLDDIQRSTDVRVHVARRRVVRVWDRNQSRKMQHHFALADGSAYAAGVADVTGEYLELAANLRRAVVEPTTRAERVVHDERTHLVPPAYESLSEVRADEPVCARDQSLRHECIVDLRCSPRAAPRSSRWPPPAA